MWTNYLVAGGVALYLTGLIAEYKQQGYSSVLYPSILLVDETEIKANEEKRTRHIVRTFSFFGLRYKKDFFQVMNCPSSTVSPNAKIAPAMNPYISHDSLNAKIATELAPYKEKFWA